MESKEVVKAGEEVDIRQRVFDQFESTQIHLGVIGPKEEARGFFQYNGDKSDIEYISPDCGCTATTKTPNEEGMVEVVYSENITDNLTVNEIKDRYPAGVANISKGINLYLRDGQPLYVVNDKGYQVLNRAKAQIRLLFNVDVKF